ncbi:MAG: MFS transporter [Ilumatobacteraceae bacterium]
MRRLLPFALHQLSNVASGVGNGVVLIVIPWLVLDRTGSAAAAGVVAAMAALPGIFVSPLIGVVIDRIGRRQVSIGADILSAVSVSLFPIFNAVGDLTFGIILALAILGAVFDPAGYTARKSLIPDSAKASHIDINSANGIHEGFFSAGFVIGPALGAVLISTIGAVHALIAAGVMFGVAAVSIGFLRISDVGQVARIAAANRESFVASMMEGLRILRHDKALFLMTIMVMIVSAAYMPTETVILPVHFESVDNAAGLGWTMSALSVGAMLSAFSFGWIARRLTRYRILLTIAFGISIAIIPMSLLPGTLITVIFAFLLGASWGPFNPLWNTLVQARIPAEAQGRVYGIQLSMFIAAVPVGQLITGIAIEQFGLRPTYQGIAVTFVVIAFAIVALPIFRDLNRDRVNAS